MEVEVDVEAKVHTQSPVCTAPPPDGRKEAGLNSKGLTAPPAGLAAGPLKVKPVNAGAGVAEVAGAPVPTLNAGAAADAPKAGAAAGVAPKAGAVADAAPNAGAVEAL